MRCQTFKVWGEDFNSTTTLWSTDGFPHSSHSWMINGVVMLWSFNTCKGCKIEKHMVLPLVFSSHYNFFFLFLNWGVCYFSLTIDMTWQTGHRLKEGEMSYLLWFTDEFKLSRDSCGHFDDDFLHIAHVRKAHLSGAGSPRTKLYPWHQNTSVLLLMPKQSASVDQCAHHTMSLRKNWND